MQKRSGKARSISSREWRFVYLGRQRGGGVPDQKNTFRACVLRFEPGVVCFSLRECSKPQRLGQKLQDKASSSLFRPGPPPSVYLMLITAQSSMTTCVFTASNPPWSIKLFTSQPGCCPLRRIPFSNFVHMSTSSLVPRPKTTCRQYAWLAQSPVVVSRAYQHHVAAFSCLL